MPSIPQISNHQPGYIYVIACGEYQKIGQSSNPMQRMFRMRTDNPYPLRMIAVLSTCDVYRAENYVHQRYAAFHYDGEWYRVPPDELAWLLTVTDLDHEVSTLIPEPGENANTQTAFGPEDVVKIRSLLAQGWRKTRILSEIFGCRRGGSPRYRQLSAAFDEIMH